jgi:hypothetical protein
MRAGRSFMRKASTSAIVKRPALRIRSASRSSTGTNATRAQTRPMKPSRPKKKIRPAKPRNDEADM